MSNEVWSCQNCKQQFTIEPEDFDFYRRINVPPPTWCSECRLIRRLLWRNERALYKRTCDLCKESTLAVYSPSSAYRVYCVDCWWSDKWDPTTFGTPYNFSVPFFEQYRNLMKRVPLIALAHRDAYDSQYANYITEVRNVYLSYSTIYGSENVFYSKNIDKSRWIYDSLDVSDSERCYQNISVVKNFNCTYAYFSRNCIECDYVYDCVNCRSCFLCANLRSKQFCILNNQYSREEYPLKLQELKEKLGVHGLEREFEKLRSVALNKYARAINCVNSTGDDLHEVKNLKEGFNAYNVEDSKYVFRSLDLRNSYDATNAGRAELFYEFMGGGADNSRLVRFCSYGQPGLDDVHYIDRCGSSSYLFGCIALRSKQYCILNKQYSKVEYEAMLPQIIQHMNDMPYTDESGRVYEYGEFFPPELSPFAYNETVAQEHFPLTKSEASAKGYRWKDDETKTYSVTLTPQNVPDNPENMSESILSEIIGCEHEGRCSEQCTTAFKLIPEEVQFYKQQKLPPPRLCPNCRHYQRLKQKNPLRLWHRACTCAGGGSDNHVWKNSVNHFHGAGHCPNEFETPYALDREETVYCEQCYNAEVV